MTPQLQTGDAGHHLTAHLTDEQFAELLDASPRNVQHIRPPMLTPCIPDSGIAAAEAHLLVCEKCAAELAALRESISLFRQASSAYADNQLRSLPQSSMPLHRPALQPAYWAAAAAILLASLLPVQMLYRHSLAPKPPVPATLTERTTESDEALLEDVNREISESVPTPMQALADPTSNTATSVQSAIQRKD